MADLLTPVPREVLLETAEQLFDGTDYLSSAADVKGDLSDLYTPAHIRTRRLLVSGMIPDEVFELVKEESGKKIRAKFEARDAATAARESRPFKKVVSDLLKWEKPVSIKDEDYVPDISGDVIESSRGLRTELRDVRGLATGFSVHQWTFSGVLRVAGSQFSIKPEDSALMVSTRNMSVDGRDSYANGLYLSLPFADTFQETHGYNSARSSFEGPTSPYTDAPAHPSVVMHRVMSALIEAAQN